MTVRIELQVPNDLMKKMKKLDDASVAARCDDEIEKRVQYLENVLKGWKTFKKVKDEHRRVLYLMLMMDNKDPLYDYEKLVLCPKVEEMNIAEASEKKKKQSCSTDLNSTTTSGTSTIQHGSDSTESSPGDDSGLQSPTDEYKQTPSNVKFRTPEILIEDYEMKLIKRLEDVEEDRSSNSNSSNPNKEAGSSSQSTTSVVSKRSMSNVTSNTMENADTSELPEDETVVGAAANVTLSNNIALAAQQVRAALKNVELLQTKNKGGDAKTAMTKMNLLKLQSKLIQSASEVSQEELNNTTQLSRGVKKRLRKAAQKTAQQEEVQRKEAEKLEHQRRQVEMAREAVKTLEALELLKLATSAESDKSNDTAKLPTDIGKESGSSGKTKELRELEDQLVNNDDFPMTEEELEMFHEITKKSQTVFEPGSKEERVMKKYEENKEKLHAYLKQTYIIEQKYNQEISKNLRKVTDELQGIAWFKNNMDQHDIAMEYILNKLFYWKKSEDPRAAQYVSMYLHFRDNCNPRIANLISEYIPYEFLPNADFETTMLLQFQSGRFFDKKLGDDLDDNECQKSTV